ncbi:lysozyme inhibitor LprI family protein [Vibrio coralliilyticus]|uniref:lysozyme inhibitor LprI family protein n=1 Tax=Vibrio coralliilyticus TaxID=190893 RepID=UPI0015611D74|nr:lysozyme inhibitor LprI family protein [Vibrio coralliilyticus]NRF13421.1 DUF1311 domain-containing protein [Vibrio coralliilyticus]
MFSRMKLLPLLFITYSGYSLSYQMYDFSDNYVEKLKQRESEYKEYDTELNNRYKIIKNKLSASELDEEFKSSQLEWINYKTQACSVEEFFPNGEPITDVMTKYLIAECNSWVTKARLVEFDYIENNNVELAYLIYSQENNIKPLDHPMKSWNDYIEKSCQINNKLYSESNESCKMRLNFYYKEISL